MPTDCDELISLSDLIGMLPRPVTKACVYNWIKDGVRGVKLPTVRVGARHFVRPADLESFMAALNSDSGRRAAQ